MIALLMALGFAEEVAASEPVAYQLTERSGRDRVDAVIARLDRRGDVRAVVTVLALARDDRWVSQRELMVAARLWPWAPEWWTAARLRRVVWRLRETNVIDVRTSRDPLDAGWLFPSGTVREDYRLRVRAYDLPAMGRELLESCRRTQHSSGTGAMTYTWVRHGGQVVAIGSSGVMGAVVDFTIGFQVVAEEARELFSCGYVYDE